MSEALYEEIRKRLQHLRRTHTLQELSEMLSGVTKTHIADLSSGKRRMEGLTLEYLFKIFPHATISLDGSPGSNVQTVGDNSAAAIGDNNTVSAGGNTPAAEALRARIISALIRADLPADALKSVLTIVQDTK